MHYSNIDLDRDHALPTSAPNANILKSNSNPTYPNPNRHHNHERERHRHQNSTPVPSGNYTSPSTAWYKLELFISMYIEYVLIPKETVYFFLELFFWNQNIHFLNINFFFKIEQYLLCVALFNSEKNE